VFLNTPIDGGVLQCAFCHKLPIGTDGFSSFEGEPQEFKIPHLRNLYQKVGTFGVPPGTQAPATGFLGDQVRGFGFLHAGSIDSVFDFLHANVFAFGSNADTKRRQVEAFLMAFDTGLRADRGPAGIGHLDHLRRLGGDRAHQPHDRARERRGVRSGREGRARWRGARLALPAGRRTVPTAPPTTTTSSTSTTPSSSTVTTTTTSSST